MVCGHSLKRFFLTLLLVPFFFGIAAGSAPNAVSAQSNSPRHEANFSKACEHLKTNKFKDAHDKLKVLAGKNHAKSMTVLGLLYERGLGVEKDLNKAADYYKQAASKGLPEAESRLGHLLLESGDKIKKQSQSAEYWIERAAQHGVAEAQATLGRLYYEGNHLPINNSEAVRWLRQAASQGHYEAQNMLSNVPVLKSANDRFKQAGSQYQTGMGNLTKAWTGYADIVNSVNAAATYQPHK